MASQLKYFIVALILIVPLVLAAPDGECQYNGELLPDTEDCTAFWECVGSRATSFTTTEFHCDPGLCWNNEMKYCDYPGQCSCF